MWDLLLYPAKDKLWSCISVQMRKLNPLNTEPVFSGFQFVPSADVDSIIITKLCFYLYQKQKLFKLKGFTSRSRVNNNLFCGVSQNWSCHIREKGVRKHDGATVASIFALNEPKPKSSTMSRKLKRDSKIA